MTTETRSATCSVCGKPYTYHPLSLWGSELPDNGYCDSCDEARVTELKREAAERDRQERIFNWSEFDLPLKDTDFTKLQPGCQRIQRWVFSSKGPFVQGPSGTGKTRSVIALIHRLYVEEGRSFKFITWTQFGSQLDAAQRYGSKERERFIEGLCRYDFLAIDDVGKDRPTEPLVAAFFRITDYRTARGMPVCLTTKFALKRDGISPFEARLGIGSPDAAKDITRRLLEHCSNHPLNGNTTQR